MSKEAEVSSHAIHKYTVEEAMKAFAAKQHEHAKLPGMDHVKVSRGVMLSYIHLAAIFAVDTHMDEEDFIRCCRHLFEKRYNEAPKFA